MTIIRSSERLDTPSSGAFPCRRTVLTAPRPPRSQSRSRGSILHPGSSIDTPWVACTDQVSVAEPTPRPLVSVIRPGLLHPGSSIDTPRVARTDQVLAAPRPPRPLVPVVRPGLLQACPAWRVSRCPVGVLCVPSKHCHPLGGHSVPDVAVHVHGCGVAPDR